MTKKATIIITLIEESKQKTNQQLEKEIYTALTEGIPKIPWMKEIEKVRVTDCGPQSRLGKSLPKAS
ncbi:MAG: hypothetical protein QHH18_07460 [Candidatus Bathyarchaeota archaeon]|jgi:hypothetical protein|nr:hypothetical protein [Candidatus Bathyarchaeota archaeon A05DMB-5]MDH7558419.1 hypothetical protein [Candidatus Bathyarchaeota archaeon]